MPKNNVEIERKFLVNTELLPYPLAPLKATPLTQGYLSHDPWVRVRLVGTTEAVLTIKGRGSVERAEFEYPIPYDDAKQMLTLCKSVITKIRYEVMAGHKWVIDEFHGALEGLVMAEIELTHVLERFDRPVWAGVEVTEDPRYSNAHLAEHGLPR